MPELPEVETILRGIAPHIVGRTVRRLVVREPRLRWPVPGDLAERLRDARITGAERRAKYLLLATDTGTLILHLGMSGRLRLIRNGEPAGIHDHIDMELSGGKALRFTDPRRFGTWLWTVDDPLRHRLLERLGPEPLGSGFTGPYLYRQSRRRKLAIKSLLMDSHVVVGVGNIYANEALFVSGIHPGRAAGRVGRERCARLVEAVRGVLENAIRQGGTTLRDFSNGEGKPGYFQLSLNVYGKRDGACPLCHGPIRESRIGQRSTFYCPRCQR
jgi:formamidopyrimidine-DNA glycosylase